MRIILIFISLLSFSSIACIPCDIDSGLIVTNQAKPKFPKSYVSEATFGQATVTVDVDYRYNITNIKVINLMPSDLPKEAIIEMIKKSNYRFARGSEKTAMCGVKNYELTFEFDVPQKIKFELSLYYQHSKAIKSRML